MSSHPPSPVSPAERLENALRQAFPDARVLIANDEARHRRHPEAARGAHLHATVVSGAFEGLAPTARHRLLYRRIPSLAGLGVHALALRLQAPGEGPLPSPPPSVPVEDLS
ncbi:MAG: BolA family transcriptional regulator [Gammaproteobacteria bacterium]|nr:BolA family transcriptional regulator [Gammaproteobacteria bacterium]